MCNRLSKVVLNLSFWAAIKFFQLLHEEFINQNDIEKLFSNFVGDLYSGENVIFFISFIYVFVMTNIFRSNYMLKNIRPLQ